MPSAKPAAVPSTPPITNARIHFAMAVSVGLGRAVRPPPYCCSFSTDRLTNECEIGSSSVIPSFSRIGPRLAELAREQRILERQMERHEPTRFDRLGEADDRVVRRAPVVAAADQDLDPDVAGGLRLGC